ncbi:DUF6199 family natural product biosynthesis protein [Alicyclobacillus sendaiensis]|uniref:DUF6199 domain-containing protein n=1 Tax=Alicyclobacillus sendaiensis PA2 TaxID=3029425 RepID=A0ABT6XYW1_ALISE|nr:DUF6199 family natural product biosynthesis protein [Alicyclobacillus sendaiensis]MDI9260273.1 hypothetical protein [Alicyclobacillus sendaiensis PA2]
MGFVAGFFAFVVGLFHLFAPRAAWYLHIGWKIRGAEPTDEYLALVRVGGVVLCIIGVLLFIFVGPHSTVRVAGDVG